MSFADTTMTSRRGRVRYRGTPDKTWTVTSITNAAEGGTPFEAYDFDNEASDSVSRLRYTGSNFGAWVGRTCTFNMAVSPSATPKPLRVVFASPARMARSLYKRAEALTSELKVLAEDLESIFPEPEEGCEQGYGPERDTANAEE